MLSAMIFSRGLHPVSGQFLEVVRFVMLVLKNIIIVHILMKLPGVLLLSSVGCFLCPTCVFNQHRIFSLKRDL